MIEYLRKKLANARAIAAARKAAQATKKSLEAARKTNIPGIVNKAKSANKSAVNSYKNAVHKAREPVR